MYTFAEVKKAILASGERSAALPYGVELTEEKRRYIREQDAFRPWLDHMRSVAERGRTTEIPVLHFQRIYAYEKTGSRKEYEEVFRERRNRLQAMTAVSLIDDTGAYIEPLENLIWELCNEYTWCMNAHMPFGLEAVQKHRVPVERFIDLGAAMLAHLLAETVSTLRSRLNPWIEHRVRQELERRIFPWVRDPERYSWETSEMNWSSVCGGGIGMAALMMIDDKERLAGVIDRVLQCMASFLRGYRNDGGCAEGIGYWSYGFGYYIAFADTLYHYTEGRLNLLQGNKIRAIAEFPVNAGFSADAYVNYSDAPSKVTLNTGYISRLHRYVGQRLPEMNRVPASFGHFEMRGALWTDLSLLHCLTASGTTYLPDLQWLLDRRQAGDTAIGFSAKGGHNAEPHNHNDLGHFIIHVGGENLLCDLGSPQYYRGFFGVKRYEDVHAASAGHSVPMIGGRQQKAGRAHEAMVLHQESTDGEVTFALDLTRAYEVPELASYTREFVWIRQAEGGGSQLSLTDRFQFDGEVGPLEERLISLFEPTLSEGQVHWQGARGSVTLRYPADLLDASVEVIEYRTGSHSDKTVYCTVLKRSRPQHEERFQLVFDVQAE
ncbi:MAG: hypothetical protein K0Q59_4443 [Paenibacillus sp.]|nr:hypothetical protein [Paenibacillus sp.]